MSEHVVYYQVNKDHAYWTEKRKVGQWRGGHTAGLLSHVKDGTVVSRILFDAGLGTIDGLADLVGFSWRDPLVAFVTHGHIDHHAELMLLSELWCRREASETRGPLLVYCTGSDGECPQGTLTELRRVHAYGFNSGKTLAHVPISSLAPTTVGIFTIHSLDVDHFPGAVIFVVEFGRHKVLIGWDMKTLPDPDLYPILKRPSLALVDANTWTALSQRTGHTSVEELVTTGFLPKLEVAVEPPDRYGIFLVHYGGGDDPGGAVSDGTLEVRFRQAYPELSPSVAVAQRGQTWTFEL